MVIDFCVETLRRNTQRRMSLETDFRPIIKHMFGLSSDINSRHIKIQKRAWNTFENIDPVKYVSRSQATA